MMYYLIAYGYSSRRLGALLLVLLRQGQLAVRGAHLHGVVHEDAREHVEDGELEEGDLRKGGAKYTVRSSYIIIY